MAQFKPKVISLNKKSGQSFGFFLRVEHGEPGHLIRCLEIGSPAEMAGMKDGDRLIRVNGTFVDDLPHSEVVEIVRNSGSSVTLHTLNAESYRLAKDMGVSLNGTSTRPAAISVPNYVPKPKLCYLFKSGPTFGFSLKSVRGEVGFFMVEVAPGGISHRAGIRVNDRLVEINGESIEGLSHPEVVEMIVQAGQSMMLLLVDHEADEYYKSKNMRPTAAVATVKYLPHEPRIAKMTKGPNGFGFLLKEDSLERGHFVNEIDKGSPAEQAGLHDMDRLVAVNGNEVDSCSHEQVVDKICQRGNSCSLLVVDRVTDQMYKLGKASPMLFLEEIEETIVESNLPPSYKEVVTLPILPASPTMPDRKPKLCTLVKTSPSFGFHLNGIQGKQGHHYITEVVKGGAADRAGLEDGDILVLVNGKNVESCSHDEVVGMITNSGTTLEMLVARREVYERLKADGRQFSTQMSVESLYAQVMPRTMREEKQEQDSRPDTPSEGRERASSTSSSSSNSSEESVDERF